MESLDPIVQNLDFGYLRNSLVDFYAYAEKAINCCT